jgi:hypothetical protein
MRPANVAPALLHLRGGVHPQRMATLRTGYLRLVLPACQTIFDVVSNLLAFRRQLKQIFFNTGSSACSASFRYVAAWTREHSDQ